MKKSLLLLIISLLFSVVSAQAVGHGRFAWGAEVGSAIDLTGSDMSTIQFGANVGYANSWIDILGVNFGIDMMMSNSSRYFPVAAIFRTSFTSRPARWFMDLKCGTALNNIYDQGTKASFYGSPGVGFYLARGKSFTSYISLNYIYNSVKYTANSSDQWTNKHGLSQMSVKLGINF